MSRKTDQVKAVFWTTYIWASYGEKTNDPGLTFYRDEDDPDKRKNLSTARTRRIFHFTTLLFCNRGMIPLLYTDRKKWNKWKSRSRRWNNSK